MRLERCIALALLLGPSLCAEAQPGYGDPLTITTGTVYRVGTLTALKNAVDLANRNAPATILVSNGTYVLDIPALQITNHHIMIRSVGGDRDAVVIRGPDEGEYASVGYIFWVQGDYFTVADITFGWCRYHGVQAHGQSPYDVAGLWVHNCRIVNCNEQFIKGTSADNDPIGVTDSVVENCLFEFTNQWAYQYYTGGIDAHKAVNWTVRDNLFKYIRDASGLAEHAIHFWKRCTNFPQNIVIERNVVFNCDRGIGFGLGGYADGFNGGTSVIRNNVVYNDGDGPNTDVGIGLESASSVKVDNNTVYVPYWAPIEYRWAGSSNLVFRNNLVNGNITARDGAPSPSRSNNLETAQAGWFRNLTNGDLHLLPGITNAIDRGCVVAAFSDDIDGAARPVGAAWDVGADEYDPWTTDSDGDTMMDFWEIQYSLNPTNAADASEDDDEDEYENGEEWIAMTNPANSNEFFRVTGMEATGSVAVAFQSSTQRVYTLERRDSMVDGSWLMVDGATNVTGSGGTMTLGDTNTAVPAAYRIIVKIP